MLQHICATSYVWYITCVLPHTHATTHVCYAICIYMIEPRVRNQSFCCNIPMVHSMCIVTDWWCRTYMLQHVLQLVNVCMVQPLYGVPHVCYILCMIHDIDVATCARYNICKCYDPCGTTYWCHNISPYVCYNTCMLPSNPDTHSMYVKARIWYNLCVIHHLCVTSSAYCNTCVLQHVHAGSRERD